MLILTLFLFPRILGGLTKNEKYCPNFNYKNKNIYHFYPFTMKSDFRNMSESREFWRKNRAKQSQSPYWANFFFKKPLHLLKNKKHYSIFYSKNKCTYKFHVFTIKSSLRNMSKSSEFRFKNSLKGKRETKLHRLMIISFIHYVMFTILSF